MGKLLSTACHILQGVAGVRGLPFHIAFYNSNDHLLLLTLLLLLLLILVIIIMELTS